MLTGSLVTAPLLCLVVDLLYATRGWDDGDAGGVHLARGAPSICTVHQLRGSALNLGVLMVAAAPDSR